MISIALIAVALSGCGGSSSGSSAAAQGLTGQSTCTDWNDATAQSKSAYLSSKDVETGKGAPGEAIAAWMDYLCGKTNPSTSFSSLSAIDNVLPAAQQQFTNGPTFPPVAEAKTTTTP